MIRGMGNTVRGLTPLCTAIAGHAMGPGYANGGQVGFASSGMAPGFANGGMPRYDSGGQVRAYNPYDIYTTVDSRQPGAQMQPGIDRQQSVSNWTSAQVAGSMPGQSLQSLYQAYVSNPNQATQAAFQQKLGYIQSYGTAIAGSGQGGNPGGESGRMTAGQGTTLDPNDTNFLNSLYDQGVVQRPHDGGMTWGMRDAFLNPATTAAIGGYLFAPAGATGSASMNAGTAGGTGSLGAGSGNFAASGYGATGAGASFGGAYEGGMSRVPSTSFGESVTGANMSRVPFDYAGNGAAYGAGVASGQELSPQWQAQNSSQYPTNSQFGTAQPQMSTVPGSGGPGNFMNSLYPYSSGGGSGFGGGEGGGGFSQSNGVQPAQANPNYSGVDSPQMSSYQAPSSNTYTNQGFNQPMESNYGSFDGTGGGQGYGDYGGSGPESGAQNLGNTNAAAPMQPQTQSIGQRVMGGAKQTMQNLPENFGKALPGMAASLGVAALTGGFKGNQGQNDPGYPYAQQQAQTDAARNQMALGSQQEFAANASKYGSDDYYRQMGDMSSMQFRSGRVAQRQELQRQLAAQGRDPTTINAMLQQFDNSTETGAVNAQNSSYLAARNSGLSAQQQAASMYGSGQGAQTLSNINTSANQNQLARNQSLGNLISAPFNMQAQTEGRNSGSNVNQAADQAAKASTKTYGLDSPVFSRG